LLNDIFLGIGYKAFQSMNTVGRFNEKRMIVNVKDPSKFYGILNADGTYDNPELYSFEFNVPEERSDSLYLDMLESISRYSNYHAEIKVVQTDCLVLRRTSNKNLVATRGGEKISTFPQSPSILQNAPLSYVVNFINGKTPI